MTKQNRKVNNMQYVMFLPAKILMNMHSIEWNGISTKFIKLERLMEQKRAESKDYLRRPQTGEISLEESIRKNGIIKPIRIAFSKMWIRPDVDKEDDWWIFKKGCWHIEDGNHRLIVAYDIDPNMEVPVKIVIKTIPEGIEVYSPFEEKEETKQ